MHISNYRSPTGIKIGARLPELRLCVACSPILEDLEISEAAKALWEAPFAVLSHDKFENEDPKFTYANKASICFPTYVGPCR